MTTDERERNLKIIIIGESSVGKTSIRRRYMGRGFNTSHLMTLGADFAVKEIDLHSVKIKLQIWDLAGQDNFQNIRQRFILNSHACIFVFDISRPETLSLFHKWMVEIQSILDLTNLPIVVLGNKCDLVVPTQPMVDNYISHIQKIKNLLKLKLINFTFTSAKTGENIETAFNKIIQQYI